MRPDDPPYLVALPGCVRGMVNIGAALVKPQIGDRGLEPQRGVEGLHVLS